MSSVVSHNHDVITWMRASVRAPGPEVTSVAAGIAGGFASAAATKVVELDWWEHAEVVVPAAAASG
jgi:hypothetical protein